MNMYSDNEKIKKYLDELSEEYRTLLFKALVEQSNSLEDLSVGDLLRLDRQIKKPLLTDYKRLEKKRKLLLSVGITYMALGFVLFVLYKLMNSAFSIENIISMASVSISFLGVIIGISSFVLPLRANAINGKINEGESREISLSMLKYEVIERWRIIEGIVSDLSVRQEVKLPRSVIDFLLGNSFIDSEEYQTLKSFLKMMN